MEMSLTRRRKKGWPQESTKRSLYNLTSKKVKDNLKRRLILPSRVTGIISLHSKSQLEIIEHVVSTWCEVVGLLFWIVVRRVFRFCCLLLLLEHLLFVLLFDGFDVICFWLKKLVWCLRCSLFVIERSRMNVNNSRGSSSYIVISNMKKHTH